MWCSIGCVEWQAPQMRGVIMESVTPNKPRNQAGARMTMTKLAATLVVGASFDRAWMQHHLCPCRSTLADPCNSERGITAMPLVVQGANGWIR